MVTVVIPSPLRRFSGGVERVEVEGASLRQVFENLGRHYPELRDRIVYDDDLRPGIAVSIDDEITEDGLLARVRDGSVVHIMPAMGGG
ncbi:MAG TPA: MoaD/ThiS family protein [Dehalococcoidia bacterium]|nr:MoaD/ThiS family protein [Dehalococcoidia bacterium]